ncbi:MULTISPECIES: T9SS sorting signal type C domain-containing protein [unclassified Flavobacterium]|jgi:hypothetical protein|uniref:T9SS sorting signal type C domain-containing protein n=1 Tax=unclassified Flavobacterium TaxID=196869 RepID=UPI0025BB66E0|nr:MULTISPECIES: T9SS sorting signal type C domain-containing protein [unclassified Flavobacterium]
MIKKLLLPLFLILVQSVVFSQNVGDYRSAGTGTALVPLNWTTPASWQYFNGSSWVNAMNYPGATGVTTGDVLIQAGDYIIIGNSGITTAAMGTLTISGTLTLNGDNSSAVNYNIITQTIIVTTSGHIALYNKVNLKLPLNATIQLVPGANGLIGDCSNNQSIYIGPTEFSVCTGNNADTSFTFQNLIDNGGTLNAIITTTPSPICEGDAINLAGSMSGPTGTNPPSYSWSITGPITTTVSAQNVNISNAIAGTYSVTMTCTAIYNSKSFSNSRTISVIVNALPTITGSLSVCAGSTTQLTGSATANATAPWVSATPTVATVNNSGLVTGISTGTSVITYKNSNGCAITATVTVNSLPTITSISAPAAICKGSSTTITLASITGTGLSYDLYTASSGGALVGTIPQTISPTISTTYYVEAVSSVGCVSLIRKAVTVTVNTLVDNTGTGFSSTSFCVGNQATITFDANNGSGVLPYALSYRNETTLDISTQIILTDNPTTFTLSPNPIATTKYTLLSITDANGCVNSSPIDATATATILSLPSTPSVATIQPVCAVPTGTITVTAPLPAAGITYTVTGTSPVVAAVTNATGVFSGLAAGNYSVTSTNGCTSLPNFVVINPLVLITNTYTTSWDNGTPTSNQNIVFDGTFSSTADLTACSCLVKAGRNVTINPLHTLTITNGVTVESTGTLTFDYDHTFGANPINSASLVQLNNVVTNNNSGKINYNRMTNTAVISTDYTYWSSPVLPQTLGGLSKNQSLSSNYYSFDVPSQNWKQESPTTSMVAGIGYIVGGPKSTSAVSTYLAPFYGVPNNGAISLAGTIVPNSSYLLGNPYPSAINADTFLNENATVLNGTLYFWTHNTAMQDRTLIGIDPVTGLTKAGSGAYAYTQDDYASYNVTGGVGIAPGITAKANSLGRNTNIPSGKIAAGQGFFASSLVNPTGSAIVYNNDIRVAGTTSTIVNNSQFFKTSNTKGKTTNAVEKHRVWLSLSNSQGAFKQALVGYVTGATNEYDSRFDGESFDGNEFVDFYSINQDKNLVIQGRALPFDETDEVPLGYRTTIDGTFIINIDQTDGLLANQAIFIEDKLSNTIFDLKSGEYTFTTVPGTFNDRFILRYTSKTLGAKKFDTLENTVLVSNTNKQIKINSSAETIDKVLVYDLLGRQIYQKNKVNSNELSILGLTSGHQVVVVKTVLQNGQVVSNKISY